MATSDQISFSRFFAGFDGGGSTTRVLIGSEEGSIWGYGTSLGSNPHERGIDGALSELRQAFENAWLDAGLVPQPLAGAFLGIAGVSSWSLDQRAHFTEWISRKPNARVELDHDVRIALAGGLRGRPGIAVIAGTGSSGFGRTVDGQSARAGGWGSVLDDAGGGYWLGVKALSAIVRACDGRGIPTALTDVVLKSLQLTDESGLLQWLRSSEASRPRIASLAQHVFETAAQGDKTAVGLIEEGARELVSIAAAVACKLFPNQSPEVVLVGGLAQAYEQSAHFNFVLSQSPTQLTWKQSEYSPLVGALWLAANQAQFKPSLQWLNTAERKTHKSRATEEDK